MTDCHRPSHLWWRRNSAGQWHPFGLTKTEIQSLRCLWIALLTWRSVDIIGSPHPSSHHKVSSIHRGPGHPSISDLPPGHPSNMPQDLHLQGHPLRRSAQVLHHLIQVLHQGTSTSMARPRNPNATAGAGIATEGIGTRATARAGNAAEPKKRSGIGALSHRRRRIFGSFGPAFRA